MSEETPIVETPQGEQPPVADAPLSIMEHVAEYDPNHREKTEPATSGEPAPQTPLAADATPEERAAHHSEQQRREKETGQFRPGKTRHRAASQRANAEDAPRIKELTRQIKELESKIAAPAPVAAVVPQRPAAPTVAAPAQTPQRVAPESRDPEPLETDPAFAGDPMKYLDDRFRWAARDEHRKIIAQQQRETEEVTRNRTFADRVDRARTKYDDFTAVALEREFIPQGSIVDHFIVEDDNGPEVLYHLGSHPQELDAILRLPVLQQMKQLALLSQRYDTASTPSAAAGKTGSVPRAAIRILPKPPNPVRTEAQRAETSTAPTDGSLGLRAHAERWARR